MNSTNINWAAVGALLGPGAAFVAVYYMQPDAMPAFLRSAIGWLALVLVVSGLAVTLQPWWEPLQTVAARGSGRSSVWWTAAALLALGVIGMVAYYLPSEFVEDRADGNPDWVEGRKLFRLGNADGIVEGILARMAISSADSYDFAALAPMIEQGKPLAGFLVVIDPHGLSDEDLRAARDAIRRATHKLGAEHAVVVIVDSEEALENMRSVGAQLLPASRAGLSDFELGRVVAGLWVDLVEGE